MFKKAIQMALEMGIISPVTPKSTPTTVDVTVPKKKYSSIGNSQMRSGRSSTIQTSSSGLMSKATTDKKTLLGG